MSEQMTSWMLLLFNAVFNKNYKSEQMHANYSKSKPNPRLFKTENPAAISTKSPVVTRMADRTAWQFVRHYRCLVDKGRDYKQGIGRCL